MSLPIYTERYDELSTGGQPFVVVTVVDTAGSAPTDAGSKMLVSATRIEAGSVGGGRVEAKAIAEAQSLLAEKAATRFVDWSLKADVGMTCGGRVRLYFETVNVADWPIVIFGAGHVTQALARLLVTIPCSRTCIDPRSEWLNRLPAGVHKVQVEEPATEVANLPDNAFVLCMTRGHASDLPVLQQIATSKKSFPYLGVIGSRAKASVLRKELGTDAATLDFRCPIGLTIGTNHPAEIAMSIAAQLLEVRDRVKSW